MVEHLQLGLTQTPAAVNAVGGSNFDITTVIASFGASVPLFLWLLKMHRDLITVVIPGGFRLIRREMRRQGRDSKARHKEHVQLMKAMHSALDGRAASKGRRGKGEGRVAAQSAAKSKPARRRQKKPAKARGP